MALGSSIAATARVVLQADTGQFDRGMAQLRADFSKHVTGFEHESERMSRGVLAGSGAFTHLGRSIAFASGAFLGAADLTQVITGSIKAAEDLQTQTIRTGQVFGKSATEIQKWGETATHSMHLTSGEALLLANNTDAFLKSTGLAGPQVAKYAEGITKLGNELGRLKGVDPSLAIKAIDQALVETRTAGCCSCRPRKSRRPPVPASQLGQLLKLGDGWAYRFYDESGRRRRSAVGKRRGRRAKRSPPPSTGPASARSALSGATGRWPSWSSATWRSIRRARPGCG